MADPSPRPAPAAATSGAIPAGPQVASRAGPRLPTDDADVFAALGDPVRRQILELVARRGPVTATALTHEVDITRQGIAKHLDVLRAASLVTSERHGRETRYSASLSAFDDVAAWMTRVEGQWDDRLQRLATRVAARQDS